MQEKGPNANLRQMKNLTMLLEQWGKHEGDVDDWRNHRRKWNRALGLVEDEGEKK